MKKINFLLLAVIGIVITMMVSCEKNKNSASVQAEKVKKILELEARMNAMNSGTGKMTNFMSVIGYSQYKTGNLTISALDSTGSSPDSVVFDSTNYWAPVTCAKVTDTINSDGTHTTVYDYGDGCNEYGSLMKGKITYIWKNENNSYYSSVTYDHYYSYGMEMNGTSSYNFTSDGNSFYRIMGGSGYDSTVSTMPVLFNWSGTSTSHDEITMTFDDGNVTYYKSDFSNVWDSVSYKVNKGDYYYSSKSDGSEYHYIVKEPLITDYRCTTTWVPVSGIESISSVQDGISNEYTLDYGNGTCDNLALLTENGKTSVVDFGELYKIVEPMLGGVKPLSARSRMK
ncbi:MAG TPA: hypothetical protein VMT63_12685 [Bacteroidales bacterium]|nr:hypothetical protein [Bacteroidales bacterium]